MPFHILPNADPEKPQSSDLGLLTLRILVALIFFYYQLGTQLVSALRFVWNSEPWELVGQLREKGFPMPEILAVCAIAIFSICLFGLALGFFTRFNAFILTLMSVCILLTPLVLSTTLNPQSLTLYIGVLSSLAWGGGGRISLDYLLANHRQGRRKSA